MIAMALILEPKVIIADEPTTALDVTTQAQILQLIKEVQRNRQTGVIFITHDFSVVAEIADRVAVMQHGKLIELGKAKDILNHPQQPYTKALIAAVPSLSPRPASTGGRRGEVLQAVGLSKTFTSGGGLFGGRKREVKAVQNVNLTLRRGETIGIVGESGSGKSTLARLIIRLIEADKGEVLIDGNDFLKLNGRQARSQRKRIQMVFQDPYASLNPRYKVGHIIAEGPLLQGVPKQDATRRVNELLDLVGLDRKAADRFPHEFSGGQRSALDVSVQAQVLRLLADIRDRLNLSMLFITHDLCVAAQVCDHIMVMRRGEVVEAGPTAEVFAAPKHDYTRALFTSIPGRAWIAAKESVL